MRAVFHPRVYADLAEVMAYYERVATRELADAPTSPRRKPGSRLQGFQPRRHCEECRELQHDEAISPSPEPPLP